MAGARDGRLATNDMNDHDVRPGERSQSATPCSTRGAAPMPSPFISRSRVRVRYAETDKMGVVYYANYFVWFEIGRTDWLRGAGLTYRELEAAGIVMPVVETHCEYRRPARYDDDLDVRTRATLLSRVRVRFDYEVRACTGDVAAAGYTVHACVDAGGRLARLPDDVRRLFA